MPHHQDKDASFEAPETWVDRTIVMYVASTDKKGEAAPNFVMTRDLMREEDSLHAHVQRQMLELNKHLKDFSLLERKDTTLGGQPSVLLRYTWMGEFGRLEQSVTVVERRLEQGRTATSFTTTTPSDKAEEAKPIFEKLLKTVQFATLEEEPPTSRSPNVGPANTEEPTIPIPGYPPRDRR